jgi:hypothetical protein
MVIVPNTTHPIVDTNQTMVLVNLAWLFGKQFSMEPVADNLSMTGAKDMLTETPLPDPFSFEAIAPNITPEPTQDPMAMEPTQDDFELVAKV